MNFEIRNFEESDFPAVKEIYQLGMDTGNASFELVAPDWDYWNLKFLPQFRLVAVNENKILGWVALMRVSSRVVLSGVCEVSVYVHPEEQGKGIGKKLMQEIISLSEANQIWTLQSGIFPENQASIQLHLQLGFRQVGIREKFGKMNGRWRDVIFLERRSKLID